MVVARPKVLVVEDDESLCQAIELGWMKPSRPREADPGDQPDAKRVM